MKKGSIIAICVLLVLILPISACSNAGPKEVVDKALSYYKQKNYTEFNKLLTQTVNDFNPDTTEKTEAVFDAFSNLDYEVKDVTVSGGTAKVVVSVTSIAIVELVTQYINDTINMSAAGELPEDGDEMDAEANGRFDKMIKDPSIEKHTEDVVVELEKYGSNWKIVTTKEFINAMTCFQYGTGGSES